VDAVGLEVSQGTADVVYSFIILGGVCISGVCVVFSTFSPSACFGDMVVHFAVSAFVLLASVSSSTSSSATLSATTVSAISAAGVLSRSGGCITDFVG